MLEVQAVLGRIQLKRMEEWTRIRQKHAAQIDQVAGQFSCIRVPQVPSSICHGRYKHYIFIEPSNLKPGWSRDRIIQELAYLGVPAAQGSCSEVYLEKAFDGTTWRPAERLPNAKLLGETSLMFMVHPTLSRTEMDRVTSGLQQVLSLANR